jgi:hypothetical protein
VEFIKEVLKVKVYGNEYEISFPKFKATIDFQKKMKEAGDDNFKQFEVLLDFLSDHGLPKNVSEELQADHLLKIVESLTKKN